MSTLCKKIVIGLCAFIMAITSILFVACNSAETRIKLRYVVDGNTYEVVEVVNGEINPPEDPTKAGYVFDGWYLDNGTWETPLTVKTFMDTSISNPMKAYAKFTLIDTEDAVFVDKSELSLIVGEQAELRATTKPVEGEVVTWTSSNSNVATVNDGVVSAVASGTAVISARYNDERATCTVTVKEPLVIDDSEIKLVIGEEITLTTDNEGEAVTWYTSNENVATVVNGKVEGIENGVALITAVSGREKATCLVRVKAPMTIATYKQQIVVGESLQIFSNNAEGNIAWTSSVSSVANVDNNGLVLGQSVGTTVIKAVANGEEATVTVTVVEGQDDQTPPSPPVQNPFDISNPYGKILVGQEIWLSTSNATSSITWTSLNQDVATVDSQGKVTAIGVGQATVKAVCNGQEKTCVVEVIRALSVNRETLTLDVGTSETLTVSNAQGSLIWTSVDTSIATVTNGLVVGVKKGVTTITVTDGVFTATCVVSVFPEEVEVPLAISKTTLDMYVGQVYQLFLYNGDGAVWSSNNGAVSVADGILTANSAGTATVKATVDGKEVSCVVTVKAPLTISTTTATVEEGKTVSLSVTNGVGAITWESSDASVASVNNGKVTGVSEGQTIIFAQASNGEVVYCLVNVTAKPSSDKTVDQFVDPYEDWTPVIRFAVVSDMHVRSASEYAEHPEYNQHENLTKMFDTAYEYAHSQDSYNALDAVFFVGDITNTGTQAEFDMLASLVNNSMTAARRQETELVFMMGNHDYFDAYGGWSGTDYNSSKSDVANGRFQSCINQINQNGNCATNAHTDSRTINGFQFISLSGSAQYTYVNKASWLEEQLSAANNASKTKPIFTFQHLPFQNTTFQSDVYYLEDNNELFNITSKYQQVVNFSGHTHGPVNDPRAIWQNQFTAYSTGGLEYMEMYPGLGNADNKWPAGCREWGQYTIVEVDAQNHIKLLPYDVWAQEFMKTPTRGDDPDTQLMYIIDEPSNKDTYRYSKVAREFNSTNPWFEDDAQPTFSWDGEKVIVGLPHAIDKNCVYSYKFVFESSSNTYTFQDWSNYYHYAENDKVHYYTFTGIKPDSYIFKAYPTNCFGQTGDPLVASFNSLAYVSANPVNYYGTFSNFDSMTSLDRASSNYISTGTLDGSVYGGDYTYGANGSVVNMALSASSGYNGSKALQLSSTGTGNVVAHVYSNSTNKNPVAFGEDAQFLRVWVDFTNVEFRFACFGIISPNGGVFTTDEIHNGTLSYWYMPDGSNTWTPQRMNYHGCFGVMDEGQFDGVKGFKGWLAFNVKDFGYETGGTATETQGTPYYYRSFNGLYFYFSLFDNGNSVNKNFFIDEIQFVEDYRNFETYNK